LGSAALTSRTLAFVLVPSLSPMNQGNQNYDDVYFYEQPYSSSSGNSVPVLNPQDGSIIHWNPSDPTARAANTIPQQQQQPMSDGTTWLLPQHQQYNQQTVGGSHVQWVPSSHNWPPMRSSTPQPVPTSADAATAAGWPASHAAYAGQAYTAANIPTGATLPRRGRPRVPLEMGRGFSHEANNYLQGSEMAATTTVPAYPPHVPQPRRLEAVSGYSEGATFSETESTSRKRLSSPLSRYVPYRTKRIRVVANNRRLPERNVADSAGPSASTEPAVRILTLP
jgi:hypothetical protein